MNRNGQALIEVAAFFMALSVLLGGLCGFTKWMAVREKLLLAAKQGAFLYSSGRMKKEEVENRMRQFLTSGTPRLNPDGISVSVHRKGGMVAWTWNLDESVATYNPPGGWHDLLGAQGAITEKCVIKHAPNYWAPIQPWGGPEVSY